MKLSVTLLLAAVSLSLLSGCRPQAEAATALARPASILDLMNTQVDPSADALWESVKTTITAAGTVEERPETDEQWAALRLHALRLAEAPNLLAQPGRPVLHKGQVMDDAEVEGIQPPHVIDAQIARDFPAFVAKAQALQGAALMTVKAIDERNIDDFITAGAAIDAACESCHLTYWYPHSPRPGQPRRSPPAAIPTPQSRS